MVRTNTIQKASVLKPQLFIIGLLSEIFTPLIYCWAHAFNFFPIKLFHFAHMKALAIKN